MAHDDRVYVLIAGLPQHDETSPQSAAYWSRDGTDWELAKVFPPDVTILAVTAGGPGFVAAGFAGTGANVWTSADGRSWRPVSDASLASGVVRELVATASGVVAFGSRSGEEPAIWTSADGREWLAAINPTGVSVARGLQAVGSYAGRAIALVGERDDQAASIWATTGRAEWRRIGSLSGKGTVERVAGGEAGWAAIGSNRAWTSRDGETWSDGVPGPDVASDLIADDAGFVAVGWIGSLPGETCGDQRPFAGHTWTSSDGRTWQLMPTSSEFKTAMVTKLLVLDRTLVGYGQRVRGYSDALPVARWTAPLPPSTRPAPASDAATRFVGCGG